MRLRLALLLIGAAPAALAQSSPWYVGSSLSITHDSNLLRLGQPESAPAGASQSDTITSIALVGGLDQPIGRQRLTGSFSLRDNRFSRNDRYNNQSYNVGSALQWSSVYRLSGSLSAGLSRNLSTFNSDVQGVLGERNYETTKAANASISVGVVTEWSLEAGLGARRLSNSLDQPITRSRDFWQDDGSLGIAWRPSDLLGVTLSQREVQGTFPRFSIDASGGQTQDRFTQRTTELAVRWQASGASALELRVAGNNTGYETNASRDFDGVGGSLSWAWQPTGRLRLISSLGRDDGRDNYPTTIIARVTCRPQLFPGQVCFGQVPITITDRRTVGTARVQADWQASAKIALSTSLQSNRRAVDRERFFLDGTVVALPESGTDTTTIFTLGGRWGPQRWSQLGCDLRHETRSASGTVTTDLRGTSFNCYAQFTLQ
jgi:hypothetical protein